MLNLRTKIGALALGTLITFNFSSIAAWADEADAALVRVKSLEKELASVKRENETLRQIKRLREENTKLAKLQPVAANARHNEPMRNPQDAYAADMPSGYYKAPPPAERGLLKLWAEGGAIWSGGDPIYSFYNRSALGSGNPPFVDVPGYFALTPKIGWEAATGFDYRLAASPWHVSGQLRYGEARQSASAAFSQSITIPTPPATAISSDSPRADYKETHWLADMALGRDIIGNGPYAVQFKFGVRAAELHGATTASNPRSVVVVGSGVFFSDVDNVLQQSKFLGAGPRFGIDGSAPIGMGWTFDYLGDVAALFGTQRFQRNSSFDNPIFLNNPVATAPPVIDATQKFGTVFNSDIQLGVSYWISQNLKISASYRLDAFFNVLNTLDVKNDPARLQPIDRYIHGPRLAVAGQF